ncbi:MAG TPA: EscR/YscR/HrcR family type III secretion system export apparatus protein, partial [Waddliaceae bacterium]
MHFFQKFRTFAITLVSLVVICWFSPETLFSQRATTSIRQTLPTTTQQTNQQKNPADIEKGLIEMDALKRPSIMTQAVVLTLLSLLPFIVMILTSFLKIVIVLSLLRNALGVQQAPPNQIINGVAFMLSLFVMYPTVVKMYDASRQIIYQNRAPESITSPDSTTYVLEIASAAQEPLREFLKNNSSVKHRALFYRMSYKVLPEEYRPTLKPDDFIIVVPAYITSQLKDAFEIGVLIYIPFFVIDLVTSNILLAMGMMMLSPVTISMPLKLF